MATGKRSSNSAVRNPVKRRGAYPDQKALHPNETNFVERTLAPYQVFSIQVNGRSVVSILKRITHPDAPAEFIWTDGSADIEIVYDDNMDNAYLRNMNPNCTLRVRLKVI